ncbi:hypothetical protein GJQ54_05195 [Oceanospirillaceae bacterium ASx5O]|nr:hypothetical protein GJQ54_05195 [Oceanospirillaceae bacterium ASx5O]
MQENSITQAIQAVSSSLRCNQPTGSTTTEKPRSTSTPNQPTERDARMVSWLLTEITLIFPKWRELYGTAAEADGVRRVWLTTLVEQGVTNKALIGYGLAAARASGWVRPPSAGQFCIWAWDGAAAAAGIPTVQQATDAVMQRVRGVKTQFTGALYHLAQELDWHNLKRAAKDSDIRAAVEVAREKTIKRWRSGQPFRQPVAFRPENSLPVLPTERSQARKNMSALRAMLG